MKNLDSKYSYSSEDNGVLHLYRDGEECNDLLSNPLISAIYKIEQLEKDNKELREKVHFWKKEVNVAHKARSDEFDNLYASREYYQRELDKAKEIIQHFVNECKMCIAYPETYKMWYQEIAEAEQFLKGK